MTDRIEKALATARALVAQLGGLVDLDKTMWGSPAGKKRLATRLAKLLPAHTTYVEPFVGSGAVLFAKEPAEVEVINDFDPEIVSAYRTIKHLTGAQIDQLAGMDWTGRRATFNRIYDSKPRGELEKLHRFLYVAKFSYGSFRHRSFNPALEGAIAKTPARVKAQAPRLKHVRMHAGDYERVLRKYDGARTTFYLDPPYPGYHAEVGESDFEEPRFLKALQRLKGKFLLTYGVRGDLPKRFTAEGFDVRRIRPQRTIRSARGARGPKTLTTLLVSNYKLVGKQLDDVFDSTWDVSDCAPDDGDGFVKPARLLKGADPSDERFVLGIVLEPETVDAQRDIYSADEVRQAAHDFMQDFGGLGLMHRLQVNGRVKILESYIAPVDFAVGDAVVRKGTWLLAVRILDDELWQAVKRGDLTGFSIGGLARRAPDIASREAAA